MLWPLALLYVAQGLPFGFFVQVLPVLLRREGASLVEVGAAGWVALPWALKPLWARWVARGRPRAWLVATHGAMVAVLAGLALVPEPGIAGLMLAAAGLNLAAATQDIVTDGWAVRALRGGHEGAGNAVQVAGYRLGMVAGGGLLLVVVDHFGLGAGAALMAVGLAMSTLPALRAIDAGPARHEEPQTADAEASPPRLALGLLGFIAVFKFGDAMAQAMLRPLLVDRGFSLTDIGTSVGVGGFTAGLIGAAVGGVAVTRLDARRALLPASLLQAAGVASYAVAIGTDTPGAMLGAILFEHLAGGVATVALFAFMMGRCRAGHEARDYATLAATVVISTGVATALAGPLASGAGYATHFAVATASSSLVPLWLVCSRAARAPGTGPAALGMRVSTR